MDTNAPRLFLVIPCFNEEDALPIAAARLSELFAQLVGTAAIAPTSEVLFVDDGSTDATWETISRLSADSPLFCGIKLSRNEGHQNALLAGLLAAAERADLIASMDADLQDDPGVLAQMVERAREGYEVVYGVRSNRDADSGFKRATARAFYRFQRAMGVESVPDHAEYRLMSRRAVQLLGQFDESNVFLRGLVPQVGLRSCTVPYVRAQRVAGTTKYSLGRMASFALDGISSFSIRPLRLIFITGVVVSLLSLVALVYIVWQHFFGTTVPGWASTAVSIWLLGGLQLLALGVIGEYVGKTYLEAKRRPRYFVEKTTFDE